MICGGVSVEGAGVSFFLFFFTTVYKRSIELNDDKYHSFMLVMEEILLSNRYPH